MFTIVGSGFGLYGYLPAVLESFPGRVVLPIAYRERARARPELAPYLAAVDWVPGVEDALRVASAAVIALPPSRQAEMLERLAEHPALDALVLEKPVAPTPAEAMHALSRLRAGGKRFRIGYTLLHAQWSGDIDSAARPASVTWTFMAHHFARSLQNWKSNHAEGGGVLRFFGIHLLPLLARAGFDTVAESRLIGADNAQPERWEARFARAGGEVCRVVVDSRCAESRFEIAGRDGPVVRLDEPFQREAPPPHGGDRRITVLRRILATMPSQHDALLGDLYGRVNDLWERVESVSRFAPRAAG